jgi:hypothetical protein
LPLSERTRIEIYLPDQPGATNQDLIGALQQEFTQSFGNCMIMTGLDRNYLARSGESAAMRISVIWTDAPFRRTEHFDRISDYVGSLRKAAIHALGEETIVVAVVGVAHSE